MTYNKSAEEGESFSNSYFLKIIISHIPDNLTYYTYHSKYSSLKTNQNLNIHEMKS